MELSLFLTNAVSTLLLAGLIWTIQLVHYPSFHFVATERFAQFEAFHQRRISFLVVPLMLLELLTSLFLLYATPSLLPGWWAVAGSALVAAIWASTFVLQVPLHNTLRGGYDRGTAQRLVQSNWIRTVLWTTRGALVVAGLWWILHTDSLNA